MPGFTHLHTVSGFSMRYGASHPEQLAERAAERGMDALALTDRDTLAGAVRFAQAELGRPGGRGRRGGAGRAAGGGLRGRAGALRGTPRPSRTAARALA